MGAREKLNASYVNGSLLLAAIVGGLTQSWPVFFLTTGVLLAGNLYLKEIRGRKQSKGGEGK